MSRRIDWGLLVTVLLALLAAAPFLTRAGLPRDTDAELHVFRAAEIAHCWRSGVLYPRWAPDFYYGYGYPIFNYYAPLTYHLSALLALLPTVDIVAGVKGVFIASLLVGGVGVYLLVRDLFGSEAAVIAAAAFLFAPYVVFIDPHARGDLAEQFAVGLLPMAFFLLRRLVTTGGRAPMVGATLSIAALITSHNLLGAVGLALLSAYLVWLTLAEGFRQGGRRGLLAILLAAAVSGFFWLPLLAELNAIHLSVIGPGHFDFRNHFVPLRELLSPSQGVDWGGAAPQYRHNLGLAQWVLAGAGAVAWARGRTPRRRALLAFLILTAGLVFLMTPASRPVWEMIPPMAYLQFPWRLLGPAALALSVCAGAGVALLPAQPWRPAALAAAVLTILALALPSLFPHPWSPTFGDTSPTGIVRFELEGKAVGTTSTGDFLPKTVETSLHPTPTLVASYEQGGPIDKVNRATLPEGTTVTVIEHTPTLDRFYVNGDHSFVFRLFTLLFPGWRAYVDGQEVEIEPGRPEGFITFWVPKGEHEVVVRLEDTPPRRAGWWLSGVGIAGLLIVSLGLRSTERARTVPLPARTGVWIGAAIFLFVALKVSLIDPNDTWARYTSPPGEAWAAQHAQRALLGGEVELLGFDLPRRRVRSGEELTVVLYWRALRPLSVNYQSFVHLTYPSSISWGQSDALNPGGLPTTRWPTDRYVWDRHRLQIRPGTPPGEYRLEVGLYTMADGRRLPVTGVDGTPMGETVVLEVPVEVLPARRPPDEGSLEIDRRVDLSYDGQVALLGYTLADPIAQAPGFLHVTLFWKALRNTPDDLTVTVAVVDAAGDVVAMASGPPAVGRYPTPRWSRGEIVRDPYAFWLEPDLAPGTYRVGVAVHRAGQPLSPDGGGDPFVELLSVEVQRWEP